MHRARAVRLSLGCPRAALIVAPHPDDETIGAYGLIRTLLRAGGSVRVILVTDGAASHPGSARWPRERLVAARRVETRRAMHRAGLSSACIEFLGLPDGALGRLHPSDWRPLERALRHAFRHGTGLIVGPSSSDAHPDHVAVAHALARIRVGRTRRLAYRVWPEGRARLPGAARGLAVPGGALAKQSILGLYRTQTGAITDSPTGFTMSRAERTRFAGPVEWFEAG